MGIEKSRHFFASVFNRNGFITFADVTVCIKAQLIIFECQFDQRAVGIGKSNAQQFQSVYELIALNSDIGFERCRDDLTEIGVNPFDQPGVEEYKNTEGAVLLDVRMPGEYKDGHIPGSINVPLQNISSIVNVVRDRNTVLYVYCYSGSRSNAAVRALKQLGYNNAKNIGGIASYKGKRE